MLISKIFLKDMLTNKKVKNYFLFIFIFAVFSYEIIGDFIYEVFSKSNIAFITMVVVLTSTAYLIYTYSLYEKVKNYISLPIKNSRFILGFILSLILVTFLERVSFIIIVVCVTCENILINIFQVIIVSIFCILINVWILILTNKKKYLEWLVLFSALLCCFMVAYFNINVLVKMFIILLCSAIILIWILKEDSIHIAIMRNNTVLINKFKYRGNYFAKVLMQEKVYIVNTLMLIALIIFLVYVQGENYIIWAMSWAIGSVNTPVLTMLSSDLNLRKHAEMISNKDQGVWKMYKKFLTFYFLSINLFIVLLNILFAKNNLLVSVLVCIILSIIEPRIATLLEIKYPLVKWQTKQELWKHPRKYVISLLVFIFTTIVGVILL